MSWPISTAVGVLTAIAGAVLSGYVANLAVGWYRVSSREGGSAYFVILLGLVGLIAGLLVGIVTARMGASGAASGGGSFLRALGLSLGILCMSAMVIGGLSRFLAHVPPTLDGDSLYLSVEIRYPATQTNSPATEPGQSTLELGALVGGQRYRRSEEGPLRKEDARREDGRWIVPGAVPLFTERGGRLLTFKFGPTNEESFLVPLPRRPGREFTEWSPWLPRERKDGKAPLSPSTYRFRVQRCSEPLRSLLHGPFEIEVITDEFLTVSDEGGRRMASRDHYRLRHRGQAVKVGGLDPAGQRIEGDDEFWELALLPGPIPALLAGNGNRSGVGYYFLVREEAGKLQIEFVSANRNNVGMRQRPVPGRRSGSVRPAALNQIRIEGDGMICVGSEGVVDPGNLRIHRIHRTPPQAAAFPVFPLDSIAPLAQSPDRRTLVRYGLRNDNQAPVLLVIDLVADETVVMPLELRRHRIMNPEQLDAGWLEHYFAWQNDAQGVARLVDRPNAKPLPYRGQISADGSGYREYRVPGGTAALRKIFEKLVIQENQAHRQPEGGSDYGHEFRIGDQVIHLTCGDSPQHVGLFMDRGMDSSLVLRLAERFDAELATGRHDALIKP